jgi:hypothetical protein
MASISRIKLLLALFRLEPERVEPGVKMAADAVGADQHQRPDRIARRLLDLGRRNLDALGLRLALDLVADRLLDLAPVASQRRNQFAIGMQQARPLPRRTAGVLDDVGAVVLQALEEGAPLRIDRVRVGLVARMELFDVGGVAAIKKGSAGECRIRVLARHRCIL